MIGRRPRWAVFLAGLVVWLGALGLAAPGAFAAAPVVSSFSPTSGTIGTRVAINGSGFTGASAVTFGRGHASFNVVSASKINATVPTSAASGPISVTSSGGTGSSSSSFTVNPGIALSKPGGPPTTTLTVSGAGFEAFEAVDLYFDSTQEALVSANATGNFSGAGFAVPASASPGLHQITAVGRRSGLSAQTTFTVSTPWTMFHYSLKHKGSNPYENVLSTANVSGIDQDWSFGTGGSILFSSPAASAGQVYVGSGDDRVYAVNATTGAEQWSFTTGGAIGSSPAVANGVVYIGSVDRNLYALNASTGAELWSFASSGAIDSPPTVANGVVYFGSLDRNVYALDASTGAELWSFNTAGSIDSSPAVANGVVYVGSDDDSLYAVNASTGAELWSFKTGGAIESSPSVANGVVYIGSTDDHLYALNASTGSALWTLATSGAITSSPAVTQGVVYVGSNDSHLYALNASTGTERWSFAAGGPVQASPAVANGVVYVGSNDDRVYALDASSGGELWRFTTGGAVTSSPAVANGTVYAGSGDGHLYAFDLAGGLSSTVAANWQIAPGYTTVRRLTVNAMPRHAMVSVSCAGRGCPFHYRTVSVANRVAAMAGLFAKARLRPGASIGISIAAPHAPGKTMTYTIRRGAPPAEAQRCTASGPRTTLPCA